MPSAKWRCRILSTWQAVAVPSVWEGATCWRGLLAADDVWVVIATGYSTRHFSKIGNHAWADHTGAISIIVHSSCITLRKHLPTREKGGKAYPWKPAHLISKASVATAWGSGLQLTYCGSWWFRRVANRSIWHGPSKFKTRWQMLSCSFHSADEGGVRDSASALHSGPPEDALLTALSHFVNTIATDFWLFGHSNLLFSFPSSARMLFSYHVNFSLLTLYSIISGAWHGIISTSRWQKLTKQPSSSSWDSSKLLFLRKGEMFINVCVYDLLVLSSYFTELDHSWNWECSWHCCNCWICMFYMVMSQ